jgi:CPA1 family monovalent cation:H+ antiporter
MLAPITTACSPIRFMMHPALVTSVNSLWFRSYGAKSGLVLLRRVISPSRICQCLESQCCPAAGGGPNTLTSRRFRANLNLVEAKFQIFLILLAVLAGAALLARRINVAPAILLLLSGIALAFVPGMPTLELPPELVLLLVLPPLIYSASVAMSWREFRHNLRLITLLSVGCVIFTAAAVAAATHYLIGLPWSVGFLLGAIVAPPDVVAPLAIARKLGIPRRVLVVLEGEGLANDATALILYRFAVVAIPSLRAITTGAFSLPKATGTFFVIVICEMLFGAAVGWLSLRARHRARDPQIEITLSLITPYVAYWIPEHFGGSGVIATVACGLYISWNGPLLISSATRLQGIFFWDLVIYLIEGLLFLLTGFQMRLLYEKSKAFPLDEILSATVLVAVIIIVARFAWVYPATYLPRFFNKRLRARDPYPPWQNPFVIAFTGVRGAVSLAAALALPFALPGGEGFPYRDLILFVSFGVIFITLVGLGSTLPFVVKWLGAANIGRDEHIAEHEQEISARREALAAALASLDAMTDDRELSDEVVKLLRARHETRANQLPDSLDPDHHDVSATGTSLTRELIASERKFIHALLRDGKITDETRRRIERDLDLEEASLSNREYRKIPL